MDTGPNFTMDTGPNFLVYLVIRLLKICHLHEEHHFLDVESHWGQRFGDFTHVGQVGCVLVNGVNRHTLSRVSHTSEVLESFARFLSSGNSVSNSCQSLATLPVLPRSRL